MYKMEVKRVGPNLWDVHFVKVNDKLVKITVCLQRSNRKWYQSKYLYEDWTYSDKVEKFDASAMKLIENYYEKKLKKEKIDKFFENTY